MSLLGVYILFLVRTEVENEVDWIIMFEQLYTSADDSDTGDVGELQMSRFSADMLSLLDRPEGADVTFSVESGGHVE